MFKKLPKDIQLKSRECSRMFVKNKFDPILNNHSVHPVYPNSRSINITGDYRAIFYEKENTAIFIAIGTHAQLYKK